MSSNSAFAFSVIEHTFITLRDGTRLAARMWMPDSAQHAPVPAILEYLPYRKRDGTALRDEINHAYFAARGYACVRVDIRGNGESDGLMHDEYTEQELADGVEVIEWLSAQPWCAGKVGIIGISWGGFNGLQIGALAPPSLAAIVTLCSTDDRYANDIHYMGGCLLNDNMTWSSQMLGYSSRPPDEALVGERWREMWLERLENMPLLAATWLRHPHRDDYWKHGSVCEDYAAITAPVLAIGGWADAYVTSVFRLLEGLRCTRKALVGPWEHHYPNIACIEPRIDALAEITRWWDQWLKGVDTGVAQDPDLRAFVIDSDTPRTTWAPRAGRWMAQQQWPPEVMSTAEYHLGEGTLATRADPSPRQVDIATPQHLGAACGAFCAGMRVDEELPGDQREEDAMSVCFDSAPLAADLDILGAPALDITFTCDKPDALLAARLCDVRPDGSVARITWGPLNLTHHASHEVPEALEPGKRYAARVELDAIGYRLPAGHRLRLALSTTYWPMLWPSPEVATLSLLAHECRLELPLCTASHATPPPPQPADLQWPVRELLRAPARRTVVGEQREDGAVVSATEDDFGSDRHPDTGLETGSTVTHTFSVRPDEPLSATAEARWVHELARGGWRIRTESTTTMTADAAAFRLRASLASYENDALVFERHWDEHIARRLV